MPPKESRILLALEACLYIDLLTHSRAWIFIIFFSRAVPIGEIHTPSPEERKCGNHWAVSSVVM